MMNFITLCEAAEALGKLKDKKAIPYLIKFMQNDEWDFARASGALALADLNAKDSLPEILNCIENEENEFTRRDMLKQFTSLEINHR